MRIDARWRCVAARGSLILILSFASIVTAAAQDRPEVVVQPFRAADILVANLPHFGAPVTLPIDPAAPIAEPRRPTALIPLYGTLAVLQGLDMHSTMKGISSAQGREANPIMQPVVENGAALLAVKGAATIGVIWMSEKMWKKHRKAAVVSVFVVNALMAGVVANNYQHSAK
jgi:hypothetical protein